MNMNYDNQIDNIKSIADKIPIGKVTLLTGKNGSGKSLVRKLTGIYIAEKLGFKNKSVAASTSLQQRTESRTDFGALSSAMHDDPTSPTSLETFEKIKYLLKICKPDNKRFLIIDEPEIGMGEEMVAALTIFLNESLNPIPENCYGILIITHNRYIVENLTSEFLNLEGLTREEWLSRKIIPTDLKTFEEDSLKLFQTIQNQIKKYASEMENSQGAI